MFDMAKMYRRVAALEANRGGSLRFGTVTEVSESQGTARVQLHDGQNMVSHPLRVLQRRSLKDKAQCFPDVGAPVACLFAGQGFEEGVILGEVYSPKVASPNQPTGMDYIKYEDGTELWYDRVGHKLVAKVQGDVQAEVQGTVDVDAQGPISLVSAQHVVLRAPAITLRGDTSVYGNMTVHKGTIHAPDEDVVAGQVSLRAHVHTGVRSGQDTSGQPVGG